MAEGRGVQAGRWLTLLAGVAVAACAAGGPLPAGTGAPAAPGWLTAGDGTQVAVSEWSPGGRPRAVILALHGFGDHGSSTFGRAAEAWAGEGIATIAPDQRGFGRNLSRGRWPGADGLVADASGFAAQVRARFPCTPLTVLGHSMGGGVVLAAAGRGLDADALVLAAPAIWGGDRLNPIHRLVAWLAASVVPEERFSGRGVVRIQASDNLEALRALGSDPLYLSPPSAREIFGLVRVTDRAEQAAARVDLPALMLLGGKDQIVPERSVRQVFDTLQGPRRVIDYPDGWHLLFRDLQAENVWRDVAAWALAAGQPDCRKAAR